MGSGLKRSRMMRIGGGAVNAEFVLVLKSPRHSARKPLSEFALPTSTPNSVRWTATLAGASDASELSSLAAGAAATTSGLAAGSAALADFSGSISFVAAASGGAMIDFDATSGVAGVAAGVFEAVSPTAVCATGGGVAKAARGAVPSPPLLSARPASALPPPPPPRPTRLSYHTPL